MLGFISSEELGDPPSNVQFQSEGTPEEISEKLTVCPSNIVSKSAIKLALSAEACEKPSLENNPLPCVAAITSLSASLILSISTLTVARPELLGVQIGLELVKLVVDQTPNSVAIITSASLLGLIKAHLTGRSTRLPSFSDQELPPLLVYQIELSP